RTALGTRRRPRPAPVRSGRLSPPSRHLLLAPCRTFILYRHRPRRELGARCAPNFPTARCLDHRHAHLRVPLRHPPGPRREQAMMLKDKVEVIYGAGGAIGGAIARAFASEGAKVFLTGCSPASVEVVAKDIVSAGGFAEAAEVDAL